MDEITIRAFVREANATHNGKDVSHTIGGYLQVTRDLTLVNPAIEMKAVRENYEFSAQAQSPAKVMLGATECQHNVFKAHKARLAEKYVGADVKIAYGNLVQTSTDTRINEYGEEYVQKQRRAVQETAYLAVFDTKLLMVQVFMGDSILYFYGEEYVQKQQQRYYENLQQKTEQFVAPIGVQQVIPRVERNGQKTKAETEMLVIKLLSEGIKPTHIAKRVGCSRPTVYNIKKRYE